MEDRLARQQKLVRLGEEISELAAHLDAGEYRFLVPLEAFDREHGWSGCIARSDGAKRWRPAPAPTFPREF